MSCPTATAPIDINMSTITGKCDLKCSYSFRYSSSSCVATNRNDYISIAYDRTSTPPVTYNASGFDVQEIRIYTPSLHSYSGSKADAEMIIVHNSSSGEKPLLVCVPIKSNNSSSESALLFNTIVNTVASSAPSDGESTTVNVRKFNLSSLVPRKPFFSYSATEPYQPCSTDVDYIVYSTSEAALDMTPSTLDKLTNIIKSNSYDVKKGPSLFYNEKGPTKGGSGSVEIYIDCQPVNTSQETTEVVNDYSGSGTSMDITSLLNNIYVRMFLGSLLFIILLFALKYGLNAVGNTKINMDVRLPRLR
jgi:carbonic anhydrase